MHKRKRHSVENVSTAENSQLAYESPLLHRQQGTATERVLIDTSHDSTDILNNAVVEYSQTSTSSNVAVNKFGNNLYACQYEQCTFVGKNAQGLGLHKRRRHDVKSVSNVNNSQQLHSHDGQLMQQQDTTGDMDVVTYAEASGICEGTIPDNGINEMVHMCDAESVVSIDTNCSKSSKIRTLQKKSGGNNRSTP